MKTLVLALSLALAATAVAQSTYTVDPAASKLIWTARKVTGPHTGGISVKSGTITWDKDGLVSTEIVIDMTTITDTDMLPEYGAKLVTHLNSPDFFHTEAFKTATFTSTRVEKIADAAPGKPNYVVTGDLTIKGITQPITFQVLAWPEGKGVRAAADLTFDRTKYDIKYRSGQFFEDLGDKMIEDQVGLTFDVAAK